MEVSVNIYLWIGLIVGLVFSVVYISNLLKRMRTLELMFISSIQGISEDMIMLEDRTTKSSKENEVLNDKLEDLREYVNNK